MLSLTHTFHFLSKNRQHGASSTEFTLVAMLILLMVLCINEITRAQALKQLFQQALQESARAAAIHHVNPLQIEQRLNKAMLAWWARQTPDLAEKAQQQAQRAFKEKYQLHPWQITILSPHAESFRLYADQRAQRAMASPYLTINNHYQYEHHRELLKRNKPSVVSAFSAQTTTHTILDANTIQLKGVYLYEPSVVAVQVLLATASQIFNLTANTYTQEALRKGLIPLQLSLATGAQSHPIQWPIQTQQPVQRAQSSFDTTMPSHYEQHE